MKKLLAVFVLLSVVMLGGAGAWGQWSVAIPVWNASFETYEMVAPHPVYPPTQDPVPFAVGWGGPGGFNQSYADGNAKDGERAWLIDLAGIAAYTYAFGPRGDWYGIDEMVKPGWVYTVSAWAKKTAGHVNGGGWFHVQVGTVKGDWGDTRLELDVPQLTEDEVWVEFQVVLDANQRPEFVGKYISLMTLACYAGDGDGWVQWDNVTLRGEGPTPDYDAIQPWKKREDGQPGRVTSEVTVDAGDAFYIEDPDRNCGIRVAKRAAETYTPGTRVTVAGSVETNSHGERYISQSEDPVASPGEVTIQPLGMANRSLGGSDWQMRWYPGAGQVGVTGGTGVNNVGLLVRTWGKPSLAENANSFKIDDGSGRDVRVQLPPGQNHAWTAENLPTWVKVTGASGLMKQPDESRTSVIYIGDFSTDVSTVP